jgi:TetR/AcrR family transcriptional regulator
MSLQTLPTRLPTEVRQAAIVDAALNLARSMGPAQITTSDIAAAVGVTQGAVFKHFPTKDAIWLAAMSWVHTQLLGVLEEAAATSATPLQGLGAVFMAHVNFVVTHPGVPRLIFHELQQPADTPTKQEVRALLQGYRQLLLGLLKAAVRQQQVPIELDLDAAATLFVGIVQGLVMQSMLSGKPAAMRTQAERVFVVYLRGLEAQT